MPGAANQPLLSRASSGYRRLNRHQCSFRQRQVEAEEVRRGIRNAPPREKTFGDLCDYWLENRAPRKRSQKDDESIIRKHLRPAFGTMKLRGIKGTNLLRRKSRRSRSPQTGRIRMRTLLLGSSLPRRGLSHPGCDT